MLKYGKILKRTFAVLLALALVVSGVELSGLLGAKRDSFAGNAVAADGGDNTQNPTYELDLYNFIHVTAAGGNGYGRLRRTNITTASDLNDLVNSSNSPYTLKDSDIVSVTPYDFSNEILVLDAKKDHTNLDPYNGTYVWLDDILSGRASYDSDQFTGCYMVGENNPIQAFNKKLGGSGYGFVYQLNSGEEYFSAADIKCIHRDYPVTILKGEPTNQKLYSFLSITGTGVTGHNKNDYYRLSKLDDTIYISPISQLTTDFSIDESYAYYDQIVSGHYDFSSLELSFGGKTYKYKDADYKPTESDFEPYYQVVFRSIIVSEKVHHGNENWFTDSAGWLDGDGTEWSDVTSNNTKLFHRDYIATLHAPGDSVKIRFFGEDGTSILQSGNQKEGQQTVYNSELPSKPSDENYNYVLYWKDTKGNEFRNDELPMVTGAEDYTAVFHAYPKTVTVTITGNTDTKTYNGSEQSVSGYDVSISSDLYTEDDFTFSGNDVVNGTDAGTYYSELTADQFTNTNPDFDDVQFVIANQISLTINPASVTVTAKSENFNYDGAAHSNSGYDVAGLVGTDAISAVVTGSITFPSESPVANVVESYEFTSGKAANYNVTTVNGELTMNNASIAITITAASDAWTYDGTAHSNNAVTVTSGTLLNGDTLVATAIGSVTNVADTSTGNNPVAAGYKVMHGTEDVTANYAITAVAGTLTINPKAVTITAQDKSFTYDGTAHSWDKYAVSGLVGDDAISAVVTGSITFPRESPVTNELTSYEFTTGTPGNYSVTTVNGELTMTKASIAITITAASNSWTFDGEAHTSNTVTVTSGELITGDSLVATATGSVTNVADTATGNNPIAEGYKIMHGEEDVTENYAITAVAGTLTINPKAVTVTAQDKAFTYTGTAQTWDKYDVDGLVGNDKISAVVTGSITFPSESPVTNELTSYEFTTGTPGNYLVSTANGELTMTNASIAITITAASDEWTYDGSSHENTAVTVTSGQLLEGDELVADATGSVTDVADTATGNNPVAAGYKIMHGNEDVTSNYAITTEAGTLTINPAMLTITAKDMTFTYNGTERGPGQNIVYTSDFSAFITVAGLAGSDALTSITLSGAKKNVGEYSDEIVPSDAVIGGSTGNYSIVYVSGDLTINKKPVILTSASGTKEYDGTALTKPEVTVGGEGFVYGEVTDIKATGSVKTVSDGEVTNTITYTTTSAFNADNYSITIIEGTLKILKNTTPLVVESSSKSWVYDGETHKYEVYTVTFGDEKYAAESTGTYAEVTLSTGDKLTITPTTNGVKDYTTGEPNSFTWTVEYEDCYTKGTDVLGTLSIEKRTVTIKANDVNDEYNGSEITYETAADAVSPYYSITEGTLADGQSITAITITGSGKTVGDYTVTITDGSVEIGNNTANYDITLKTGTLTIGQNSAEIKVVPGSDSKMYDGTPLTKNMQEDFEVTGVPEGFTWTAVADGTVTNVVPGTDENATKDVSEFKIFDDEGNDVTDQFANIDTSATGTLSITKRSVTLTSADGEKVYDGSPLTNDEVSVSEDGFVDGEGCTFDVTGSVTDVGTAENTFTYVLNENTLADNYEITMVFGTLEVTPLEAVLKWTDTRFPYDMENHVPVATVTNLVDGDECEVTVSGEKKEIGDNYVATATELSNPNYKLPEKNTTLFSIYGCVVIFKNDDGTELKRVGAAFGTKPVYDGETPTKESTAKYSYEFDGWSPEIVAVDKDETVYTATFKEVLRTYSVEPSDLPEGVKLSVSGKQTVDAGKDFTFTITVSDGYDKNDSFAVKANGTAIAPDADGNYKISGILEDVKITVSGVVKVSYSVTEGDKTKHVIGEKTVAKYVFKRNVNDAETFGKNTEILLDGKALQAGQFEKSSGSLIVELKPDYMDTLSVGEHTLTVRFSDYDGDVNATLIVEKAADPAPGTGDTGNLTLWIVIGVVSLIVFIALFLLICKRRKEDEEED